MVASVLLSLPLLVQRQLGRGRLCSQDSRPATPKTKFLPYEWERDEVRSTWSSSHWLTGIEAGGEVGVRNTGSLPSQDEIMAPGWDLGRKRAPNSLPTPDQIRTHQVDLHNMGEMMKGVVAEIPQTLMFLPKDLVDFPECFSIHCVPSGKFPKTVNIFFIIFTT